MHITRGTKVAIYAILLAPFGLLSLAVAVLVRSCQ